ncbi:4Fe-4S dicluster domain-containing protein [Candidatus Saganbacteria bacterium]|nr:4Fe-4S dicluster domain-containing protein [Candidatus Saganbacteria bacterium]
MQYAIINKDKVDDFITRLAVQEKVYAPVARGYDNYSFEEVTSGKNVVSGRYIPTILPPKKYFMPQRETLLEYNLTEGQNMNAVVEYEKMAIFGVHTCDLAGIQAMNMVFSEKPADINYLIRKNKITIIGLECIEYCDQNASCTLVHNHLPNGGYDMFFTDIGDSFFVHVATQAGEEIIEKTKVFYDADAPHMRLLEQVRERKKKIFHDEVPIEYHELPELFQKSFDSKVWDNLDSRCIACGNCTAVCPTCYCFDVKEEPDLSLVQGKRYRIWDSCQSEPFAKVSGGESFRKMQGARQRHRYFRKFKYQFDKYSRPHCTGCGRCTRACMAKINLKETLNALIAEHA